MQFSCPVCRVVLKIDVEPQSGQGVQCPRCGEVFTPRDHRTAIQSQNSRLIPPPNDDGIREGAWLAPAVTEPVQERSSVSPPPWSSPSSSKGMRGLVFLGLVALSALVSAAVLKLWRPDPPAPIGGKADHYLAYVPGSAGVLIGFDLSNLQEKDSRIVNWQRLGSRLARSFCEFAPGIAQVLPLVQRFVLIETGNPTVEEKLAIFETRTPITAEALRQSFGAVPIAALAGQRCYQLPPNARGQSALLAAPTEHIFLIGTFDEKELAQILAHDRRTPRLSQSLHEMVAQVQGKLLWSAWSLEVAGAELPELGGDLPRLSRLLRAAEGGKGIYFGFQPDRQQGKVSLGMLLANPELTEPSLAAANDFWQFESRTVLELVGQRLQAFADEQPIEATMGDLLRQPRLEGQKNRIFFQWHLGEKSLNELERLGGPLQGAPP